MNFITISNFYLAPVYNRLTNPS